jgi:quinone-modifying oxidoreductase, subunit QmoA
MATFKHISYIRAQYPDAKIYVFYIDLRTPGKYEHFREKFMADPNITFIKGKVADIVAERDGGVTVTAENAVTGTKVHQKVDSVFWPPAWNPHLVSRARHWALPWMETVCCF